MLPLITALGFLSAPALAWEHTGRVWSRDDFPLPWYVADNADEINSPDFADVPDLYQRGFDNWVAGAPCADLTDDYQGIRENNHGGFEYDRLNTFSSRTEEDEPTYLGAGTLGVTLCRGDEQAFSQGGNTYYYSDDCDIIMNDSVPWVSTEDLEAGLCNNEYAFEAVATHEIGHVWGMGHSCEADDVDEGRCEDPALLEATMFWTVDGTCSNERSSIESDDIDGIYALYGPYCTFEATEDSPRSGGAPLEVCFQAECNSGVSELTWDFGDGTSEPGDIEICHTYEEKGQYTVALTTTGGGSESDECGAWESTERQRAYVLVCGEPEPAEGFDGLFTYEPSEGLIYQMVNQTDTTVYGCIDSIEWDVFEGTDTSGEPIQRIGAWSPKIEFPAEGTYTVVLNEGGPGGIAADALQIEVTEVKAGGCATVPAGAGLAGILVGLGAAIRRRRDA